MSLIKSSFVIAVYTFLSRVAGYVRDVFIASYLGTSPAADAFTVAFKLPNFFRTIFAEGAFSAGFIPLYSQIATKNKNLAREFANNILALLVITLFILIIIFELLMPYVMQALALGFVNDKEKYDLAVLLSRITFPYLFFISIIALLSGILNTIGRFAIVAALPIILNLSMVCSLIVMNKFFSSPAIALAIGIFIAGILQLIIISYSVYKNNIYFKFQYPKFDEKLKKLFKNMLPVLVGSGITQINLWVGTIIATHVAGLVSILYYAERLNQFPLAIIGTAIGTVLLPTFSKQFGEGKIQESIKTQNKALEISMFLVLPCSFALIFMGDLITSVLFQRDAFTIQDTIKVSETIAVYAFGLPAFVLIKVVTPKFFAALDTKTPVQISFISIAINIILSLFLVSRYQHIGIAFASIVSGWTNIILLFISLIRKKEFHFSRDLFVVISKIIFSCMIMAIIMKLIFFLTSITIHSNNLDKLKLLVLLIIFGAFGYLIANFFLGSLKVIDFREIMKRKK